MGFYGNITNTARTQFQFDRIYPNRVEMETNKASDGIYAGRYVLIEYESDTSLDNFLRVYNVNSIGGGRYTCGYANAAQSITTLTQGDIEKGTIVYYAKNSNNPADNKYNITDCKFLICETDYIKGSFNPAEFREVVDGDNSSYYINYNIDVNKYSEKYGSRGYDSTVWQKVYSEDKEKYVMIAELNTVVPTFDVAPDAPTMNPIVPHFDINSTDVYYKLHWQAPWGFRVAAAEEGQSDEMTTWTTYIYDETTNTHEVKEEEKNAAIYYNKAAFYPQVDSNNESIEDINKKVDIQDEINLSLAASGQKYNLHNGKVGEDSLGEQNDIQELTINLPTIGNMMSDAWDIIHGPLRNDARTDENSSLQGRLDSFKSLKGNQILVKRAEDGTLVGSMINSAIAYDDTSWEGRPDEILNDNTEPNFDRDDAWIKTVIDTRDLVGGIKKDDDIDQSNNSGISIHHTFHATDNSTSTVDKNTGEITNSGEPTYKSNYIRSSNIAHNEDDMIELYVPYVDTKGHVVGHNIETITLPYGYKNITTTGENSNIDNPPVSKTTVIKAENTQDTLNINPRNKWIRISVNDDNNDDVVLVGHLVSAIETTEQTSENLNLEENAIDENNINIPVWTYDEAGHITSKQDKKYTLPYNFKTIKTNGRSDEVSENATGDPETTDIVADTTQDTLAINSGNKWIRIDTDAENDVLIIRHDVHNTSETNHNSNWTTTEENTTIPVVTYNYDEAGHYLNHHTETYQLPFGYGKIVGDNGNTAATATYDELTFGSDDWLTATVSTDKVVYSHDYPKKIDDTTSEQDMNGSGKDTIILETLERDAKGHVIKVNQNTVTLPYGYKTFTGDSGSSVADNTQDSMAVNGDKQWIETTVANDNIVIAHAEPMPGVNTSASTFTPSFGGTFNFNVYDFDNKGHIYNSVKHTVIIPEPSLTNGTGNIVTGLSLASASGAFVETKADLGTIKLGTYEAGDSIDDLNGDITLQQALSRLQNKISNNTKSIGNADSGLIKALADEVIRATSEEQKNADAISDLQSSKYDAETKFNYDEEEKTKTIQDLFTLVFEMQKTIQDLTTKVETLKTKVDNEHPSTEEEPVI